MWRWPGARDIMSVDAHAGTPGPAPATRSSPHPRQSPSLFSGDRDKTRCGVWRGRRAACLNVSISRQSEQCGNTRHSSTSFCSTLFLSSVSPAPNNHSTQYTGASFGVGGNSWKRSAVTYRTDRSKVGPSPYPLPTSTLLNWQYQYGTPRQESAAGHTLHGVLVAVVIEG